MVQLSEKLVLSYIMKLDEHHLEKTIERASKQDFSMVSAYSSCLNFVLTFLSDGMLIWK